uniref:GDSL esterase/lipase At1g28590-like isoform X2 n=1 Tax=Erigeron canadensis TaxID=72917 RepID=UPI001CB9BCEE|nr:GDSL esterase/lipase At1g28590-like isoform X2 [Erigeron canadensis]
MSFACFLWVILQSLVVVVVVYATAENGCYKSIISFGDSLADTGNLKQLSSLHNLDFPFFRPPYGENFLDQSTGRCSDGRLIIDFLVAGATALNSSVLEAMGIVNLVTNSSLGVQLDWFKESLPYICGNVSDCRKFIGGSLILMGEIGGNDYNFPILAGSPMDEIKPLVPLVIDTIISAVNGLIEMGAQTLVVPGNFPVGCVPSYLTVCGSEKEEYDPTTGCLSRLNEFAEYHNELLQNKLYQIREVHPNVNIIYADYYNAALQIYRFPDKYGFTNGVLKACCGGGGTFNYNSSAECGMASASVCDQPDKYVNWDGLHFTEAAYRVIHNNLFQGPFTNPQFNSLCPASTAQLGVGLSSSL